MVFQFLGTLLTTMTRIFHKTATCLNLCRYPQANGSHCRALACRRSITFLELVEYEDFDPTMCSFAGLGELAVYLVICKLGLLK